MHLLADTVKASVTQKMSEAQDIRGLWPLKSCFAEQCLFTVRVIKMLCGVTLSMGAELHKNTIYP